MNGIENQRPENHDLLPLGRTPIRPSKGRTSAMLWCLAAVVAGIIALGVGNLHTKYVFGVLLLIPFAFAFAGDIRKFMLGAFLLLLPVALNISPFYLNIEADYPMHFAGADPTLEIWVSSLPLGVLLLIWVFDIVLGRKKIHFTAIDVPALLLIGWSGLSMLNSVHIGLSVSHLFRMVLFYLVYLYMVNNITDVKTLRFAVTILLIGFLLQSLVAMAQYWLHLPLSMGEGGMMFYGGFTHQLEVGQIYRVQGTVGWPTKFGLYIAMMLSLAFSVFLSSGARKGKIALVSLCLGFVALLLTFSRGAWAASVLGCLVTLYLLFRRKLIRVRVIPVVVVSLPLILGSVLLLGDPLYRRVTASPACASTDRVKLIQVAWEMIKARPLTGVGLNTFAEVMEGYDETGVSSYFPDAVHNHFLLIWSETGLGGIVLFFLLVGATFYIGMCSMHSPNKEITTYIIGIFGALVAVLVGNLVDCSLRSYVIGLLFWVFVGLLGACWRFTHLRPSGETRT